MGSRRCAGGDRAAERSLVRKSNWIIVILLATASVVFLWLWWALQFNLVDNPLDVMVTVVWWVVIAVVCVAIHLAEKKRQERIRTVFLAPGLMYNCETGVTRMGGDAAVSDELERLLSNLTYGFDMAELPANSRVRFQRIVRTSKFSDGGSVWEGEVVEVTRPDRPMPFHNRRELVSIVDDATRSARS